MVFLLPWHDKEGFQGNSLTSCLHTIIKLLVAFLCGILRMILTNTVKQVSTCLTKLIRKGKADVYPIAVSGGNIYTVGLNALNDSFNFFELCICSVIALLCNFYLLVWLIKPFQRIECFRSITYMYLGLMNMSVSLGRKHALEMSFPDWSTSN